MLITRRTELSASILHVSLLLVICHLSGCGGARSVSISAWQHNIEKYVREHAGGDPTVLRDLTLPDARRGYSMIGADRPAESTDANGLLLGHREISGRNWFIYLVGLVRQQRVEEVRLAALNTDGRKFTWKLGPKDTEALQKYVNYNDALWRKRFPGRTLPPPRYLGFPKPEDHFQMAITDGHVTVTHVASGAQWVLTIPAPRQQTAAADPLRLTTPARPGASPAGPRRCIA